MNDLTTQQAVPTGAPFQFPDEQRRRIDIRHGNGKPAEEPQTLSRNAAAVAQGVEDLQRERDRMRHDLDTANARIEQYQSAETRLLSELEGEKARTAEAKADAEQHRAERVRLETVLLAIRNQAHDALPES